MKKIMGFISLFILSVFFSCNESDEDFALKWSDEIRHRILVESSEKPDSVIDKLIHDTAELVLKYKNDRILMSARIDPETKDTLSLIYYGKDYRYRFIRKFCPFQNGREEFIMYKEVRMGVHKFFYSDGKPRAQGLEYYGRIGKWTIYDSVGNVIEHIYYKNIDRLAELRELVYAGSAD